MNIITRKDARNAGLQRFFTGRPCREGHTAERYTSSGNCIACRESFTVGTHNAFPGAVLVPARWMHPDDAAAFFPWIEQRDVARGFPAQARPGEPARNPTRWEAYLAPFLKRIVKGTCPALEDLRQSARRLGILEEYATMAPVVDYWTRPLDTAAFTQSSAQDLAAQRQKEDEEYERGLREAQEDNRQNWA